MKRRSLALLLALTSPQYVKAEGRPSFVGNFGVYAPSGHMDLGGVLVGGEIGADLGDNYKGLIGKTGFYFDVQTFREKFGSNGDVREGEWETNHLFKASILGRVGSRNKHFAVGGFIGETNRVYKRLDSGFFNAEVTNYPDPHTIYGPTFEVNIGDDIKDKFNMGVNLGIDVIFSEGVPASPAAHIGFGISFNP